MTERRKTPRFTIDQLIRVSFDRESFVPCRGIDLSMEGFSCRVDEFVPELSRIFSMVHVEFDGVDREITAEGVVVHCIGDAGGYRIGVQWSGLLSEDRAAVAGYLEKIRS